LQLVKNNNLDIASVEPKLGYGNVPMDSLKTHTYWANDYTQNIQYS